MFAIFAKRDSLPLLASILTDAFTVEKNRTNAQPVAKDSQLQAICITIE